MTWAPRRPLDVVTLSALEELDCAWACATNVELPHIVQAAKKSVLGSFIGLPRIRWVLYSARLPI